MRKKTSYVLEEASGSQRPESPGFPGLLSEPCSNKRKVYTDDD